MRWRLLFKAIGMVVGWVFGILLTFALIAWLGSMLPPEWLLGATVIAVVIVFIVVMSAAVYSNLKYEEDRKRFRELPDGKDVLR